MSLPRSEILENWQRKHGSISLVGKVYLARGSAPGVTFIHACNSLESEPETERTNERGAVATRCSCSGGGVLSLFTRIAPAWRRDVTQKEDCAPRCRSPTYRTRMRFYTHLYKRGGSWGTWGCTFTTMFYFIHAYTYRYVCIMPRKTRLLC